MCVQAVAPEGNGGDEEAGVQRRGRTRRNTRLSSESPD